MDYPELNLLVGVALAITLVVALSLVSLVNRLEYPNALKYLLKVLVRALTVANLRPTELDLIICATSSPEYIFPATACLVQDQLGASKAGAFDLLAACTGFIYALNMGAQAIRSGSIKSALIIGTETLSRFINWKDRSTCILFRDGGGAFVLQGSDQPGGVLSAVMHSDGSGGDLLTLKGGGSRYPASEATLHDGKHYIQMDGNEVFRFATRVMASATRPRKRSSRPTSPWAGSRPPGRFTPGSARSPSTPG